jgi:uncharacterized protein
MSEVGDRVLLFLKLPIQGQVKTRLAATLGAERATAIYRRLVERQLAALAPLGPEAVELHYAPSGEASAQALRAWLGGGRVLFAQAEGDLGERLASATAGAFARGARRVALIGTDCPALDAGRVREAWAALSGADAVYGPADDGGYYLLALGQPQPELFSKIPWSHPDTLKVSLERARAASLRIRLLATEHDVDDLESLRACGLGAWADELWVPGAEGGARRPQQD